MLIIQTLPHRVVHHIVPVVGADHQEVDRIPGRVHTGREVHQIDVDQRGVGCVDQVG